MVFIGVVYRRAKDEGIKKVATKLRAGESSRRLAIREILAAAIRKVARSLCRGSLAAGCLGGSGMK